MHANLRMRVHLDAATHPYRTKHAPSNVPFRFAIKISLRLPLISVRPSRRLEKYHRWTRMAGSARSALYDSIYIYIYIYSRDREVIRADANGGRRIPSRSSLVRIRLGRGLLCPLITIHLSQAVEHFSGSTSGQCELQLHRLSTAPPHLTKPRATNCNPCKHDDPRCVSLHRLTTSFPLPTLPPPTLPPSFLPSFLGRAPFLTISRTRRSPTTRLPLSYLRSSVSLSFSSFLFPLHPFLA